MDIIGKRGIRKGGENELEAKRMEGGGVREKED
jgi:hypothetical protein